MKSLSALFATLSTAIGQREREIEREGGRERLAEIFFQSNLFFAALFEIVERVTSEVADGFSLSFKELSGFIL
jgi:hypothetical protein